MKLLVGAHPDDIETMLSGVADDQSIACVATDGTASTVNHLADKDFVRNGRRREESSEGLLRSGISEVNQHFLGLADGKLSETAVSEQITKALFVLLQDRDITDVYTLGVHGYDGHPDHIATHRAATKAVRLFNSEYAKNVSLHALAADNHGAQAIPVNTAQKLFAMSAHKSQFLIRNPSEVAFDNGVTIEEYSIDRDFWKSFEPYHSLILEQETYSIL